MRVNSETIVVIALSTLMLASPVLALDLDPTPVGSWPGFVRGEATQAAVAGAYAYVTTRAGLQVVDISDLDNPVRVGGYEIPTSGGVMSYPTGIAVSGSYAYMADFYYGLQVIDIGDPANPRRIATYGIRKCDRSYHALALSGNYAYLAEACSACGSQDDGGVSSISVPPAWGTCGGLHIIDISDPAQPRLAGFHPSRVASGVALYGNYAYLSDKDAYWYGYNSGYGLQVIDVSEPGNPRLVSGFGGYEFASANRVVVSGSYLCAMMGSWLTTHHVQVFDLSNLTNATRAFGRGGAAAGFAVSDGYAYMAFPQSGLEIIELQASRTIATYNTAASEVKISDDAMWLAGPAGLDALDISDPAVPKAVGECNISGSAEDVAVSGNYAFVADGGGGLEIIDISDRTRPRRVGGYATAGSAQAVTISGSQAYVIERGRPPLDCTFQGTLHILDVTDPAAPRRLGGSAICSSAQDVAVSGGYAYVAYGGVGLQVIDISDPANPYRVGSHLGNINDRLRGAAVVGSFVYLSSWEWGLMMLDASDPRNPRPIFPPVGTYPDNEYHGTVTAGDYTYTAEGSAGLKVILNIPANPQRIATYSTPTFNHDVAVVGNRAFVGGNSGLQVFDISNLADPQPIALYDTRNWPYGLPVSTNFVYKRDGDAGWQVIDASDPANPKPVGPYDSIASAWFGAVSGDRAYVLRDGLQVLDVTDPAHPHPVAQYSIAWGQYGLPASQDFTYTRQGDGTWQVVEACDAIDPKTVGPYHIIASLFGAIISGNYAYSVDGNLFLIIDISDPGNPQPVGSYELPLYNTYHVAISDSHAYIASTYSGLLVLDVRDPWEPRRVGGNLDAKGYGITIANHNVFMVGSDFAILHEYQPIRFEHIARQEDGAMHLRMAGPSGVPGRLQRSADLRTWTDWLPVEFGESMIAISDPDARTTAANFYRIAVP